MALCTGSSAVSFSLQFLGTLSKELMAHWYCKNESTIEFRTLGLSLESDVWNSESQVLQDMELEQ